MHKLLKRAALAAALAVSLLAGSLAVAAPAANASISNAKGRIWIEQLHAGSSMAKANVHTVLFQRTSSKLCPSSLKDHNQYSFAYTVYVLDSKMKKLATYKTDCYHAQYSGAKLDPKVAAELKSHKPAFSSRSALLKAVASQMHASNSTVNWCYAQPVRSAQWMLCAGQ